MKTAFRTSPVRKQSGLTLLELLVALGLGLVVVAIAAAALLLGQRGYRAVDATAALRDRERFATDLISRVVVQAGYQDFGTAKVALRSTATALDSDPEPDIYGWNDAVYAKPDNLLLSNFLFSTDAKIASGNRPGSCGGITDTSCRNGSDVLVVRFQGVSTASGGTTADNTMINCAGQGEPGLVTDDLNERAISMFHVARGTNGEPSLYCSYFSFKTGVWVAPQPMIEGVETFQVLYGTDGMTAAFLPSTAAGAQDSVADRWLRADQLKASTPAETRENWRRVRAVKIGMVLRAPIGSAPQSTTATFAPLGSLYASSDDVGTSLVVAADSRLRMVSNLSVHLRNDLTLR